MMYTRIIAGSQCAGGPRYLSVKYGVPAQSCGFCMHSACTREQSRAKSVNVCMFVHDVKCCWRFVEVRSDIKQRNCAGRPIPPTTGRHECQHREGQIAVWRVSQKSKSAIENRSKVEMPPAHRGRTIHRCAKVGFWKF